MIKRFLEELKSSAILNKTGRWHANSQLRLEGTPLQKELHQITKDFGCLNDQERIKCLLLGLELPRYCLNCEQPILVQSILNYTAKRYCNIQCSNSHEGKKEVTRQSMVAKYGVDHNSKILEVKQAKKDNAQEQWGVNSPFQVPEFREKAKATTLARHGYEHGSQSPVIRKQIEATNQERFGAPYPFLSHLSLESLDRLNDAKWLESQLQEKHPSEVSRSLGCAEVSVSQKANALGIDWGRLNRMSAGETQVLNVIKKGYDGPIKSGDRRLIPPFEIDIYLPEKNLAIEYNGVYWHSEHILSDTRYHQNKMKACEEKGVQLIQVCESEWALRREIVISRLHSVLGSSNRIFARKCKVVEVSPSAARGFFNVTHIQGPASSAYYQGLEFNNELVAVIGAGICRYRKDTIEIIRYSSKLSTNVVGGFSRLMKQVRKSYPTQTIISYCDLRWGRGGMYLKAGFTFEKYTTPNYKYFGQANAYHAHSRQAFQKHLLKDKLKKYDAAKTEYQNMVDNGYCRVWDAGNAVFIQPPPQLLRKPESCST